MYRVRHETNRKAPEPRLPPFTAVGWLTPRRSLFTTTQTHTPPTRTSPGLGRGSCLSLVGLFASPRRCRWAAWAGWVGSSCPPPLRGWGRTAPPLRGGSLPSACSLTSPRLSCACVGVRLGASVCGRLGMRDRVVEDGCKGGLASLGDGGEDSELLPCSRILGRNLEFGSFLKSHFWAGYVCFALLRECISISVTCGDSCNR